MNCANAAVVTARWEMKCANRSCHGTTIKTPRILTLCRLLFLAVWINRTPSYTGCKFPGIAGRSEDNATRTACTPCDHKVLAARDISGSCQPNCLQEIVIASADDCEDASYYQFCQPRCQKSQKSRKSQDVLLPARNSKMHSATPFYNARKHHSAQPSNSPNSIILCTVDNGTAVG